MEKTIKISLQDARELYKKSTDPAFKEMLEKTFGKKELSGNIIDRIKTWKDVLEESGKTEDDYLPFLNPKNKQQIALNAVAKIQLITEVLNEGAVLDFNDTDQAKFYPWFKKERSGWVLGAVYDGFWYGVLFSGAYFKSRELAEHAVANFMDIYKEYLPE